MHGTYPASQAQPAASAVNNPAHMRSPPVHHIYAHGHAHTHAPRAPLPQQHAVAPHHGQYTYAGGPWLPGPPHAVNPGPYQPALSAAPPPAPQGLPLTAVPYAPIEPHARHATSHSAGAPPTWSPPGHEYARSAAAPMPHHEPQSWSGRDMDARQPPPSAHPARPPPPPPPSGGRWVYVPSGAAEPQHYTTHPRCCTTSARTSDGKHEVDVEPDWSSPGAGMPPVHAHAQDRDARWRRGSGESDWAAHGAWTRGANAPQAPAPAPSSAEFVLGWRRVAGEQKAHIIRMGAGALDRPLHTYTAAELNAHIGARKKRRNFTKEARSVLFAWLDEHEQDPYPTEAEKRDLAAAASLTVTQINYWFVNARRRTLRNRQLAANAAAMEAADLSRASSPGTVRTLPQQPPARTPAVATAAAWHSDDEGEEEEEYGGGALSDDSMPLSDIDSDGEYVPEQMGKSRRGV
ncbi:hypothetical protein AMAG_07145 [Allomyces macrogynus ATCC 38327]|uniref:Homeobox domain-containing protein n=1 Tax=Allomyces macrogynus (strain ATCC 38327) TaxID=578462 RepID=A0A0L0SH82_ALLM3|nr:hypothetical protein AMAG_07145 [Allomyces macrogynus ATCC 38327]|eukprot:KNE61873.1 hypothetical protein AMAG_07145 [Allomyces macrogynus ATCC 38327]